MPSPVMSPEPVTSPKKVVVEFCEVVNSEPFASVTSL